MSPIVISLIVIFSCLALGAISVGIYVAIFNSKPENKGKTVDPSTIWLIMVIAFLGGLLAVAGYLLWTGRECQECSWGAQDSEALKGAQTTFDALQKKVDRIPRDMSYTTVCDSGDGCGVRTRSPPS